MEKEITLLPEQVQRINEMLDEINQERKNLVEIYKGTNTGSTFGDQGFSDVVDSNYVSTITNLEKKKERLEKLLSVAKIISEYNGESISIGTRFAATLDYEGDMETAEYILVSTKEGSVSELQRKNTEAMCITTESPFGKAVVGKRIGDPIFYQVNGMNVVGFVEDITPIIKEEQSIQKIK